MNTFERMNAVIDYIEANLTHEISLKKAADIACCPQNQFQRIFSYLTEITITEYIRRRRLTLSAYDLQKGGITIIDVALRYGYDSHTSFTRAFKEFHGITPSIARNKSTVFNIFPRLTFQPQIFNKERSDNKLAVLGKLEFIDLPAVRMIGKIVTNGGGENPVPELWEKCFRENTFDVL